jgi:hypothetical protein
VLHARQRTGRAASGRGAERFVNELAGRVRRAGASGPLILRADAGFWAAKVLAACRRHGIQFSITIRQTKTVAAAIAAIGEHAWTDIDYPDGGHAQVTETTLGADRLIVRRTRLAGPPAPAAPADRLAMDRSVPDRAGRPASHPAAHLIPARPPERCPWPAGPAPACPTDASSPRCRCSCHRSSPAPITPSPRAARAPH